MESIKPDNKIPTILIMIINLNRFSIPSRRLRFGLKKKIQTIKSDSEVLKNKKQKNLSKYNLKGSRDCSIKIGERD